MRINEWDFDTSFYNHIRIFLKSKDDDTGLVRWRELGEWGGY